MKKQIFFFALIFYVKTVNSMFQPKKCSPKELSIFCETTNNSPGYLLNVTEGKTIRAYFIKNNKKIVYERFSNNSFYSNVFFEETVSKNQYYGTNTKTNLKNPKISNELKTKLVIALKKYKQSGFKKEKFFEGEL